VDGAYDDSKTVAAEAVGLLLGSTPSGIGAVWAVGVDDMDPIAENSLRGDLLGLSHGSSVGPSEPGGTVRKSLPDPRTSPVDTC
jgi:hypothetical protein